MSEFVILHLGDWKPARLEIFSKKVPLYVAPAWDWKKADRIGGLFFVYLIGTKLCRVLGPWYASIALADGDMKKLHKAFPAGFWSESSEWIVRQTAFSTWIEKNMGRSEDLIGGVWVKD